ncbi:MAG TPA: hypothetical protein VF432_21705 [Thermoanaerobaculia bacterium]
MEHSLTIIFKGICTHLTATHELQKPGPFTLFARRQPIQHRIFIASSAPEILKKLPKDRCVVPHVPRLRILADHITPELKDVPGMEPGRQHYELVLSGVGITFEDLDHSKKPHKHHDDVRPLPSMYALADEKHRPALLDDVLAGWTENASAYVDFPGGVKFTAGLSEVLAELAFQGPPRIVFYERNAAPGKSYPLKSGTLIEISNHPSRKECGDSDYLLHYLATDLDLKKHAPTWPKVSAEDKLDALSRGAPAGEVYCTNSTYP